MSVAEFLMNGFIDSSSYSVYAFSSVDDSHIGNFFVSLLSSKILSSVEKFVSI